ncbi:MAG: histidine phosphatase family protein [Coriobacteriia bacterium]
MNEAAHKPDSLVVYLMRHADARPDGVRRFVGGRTDWPLNDEGRQQAADFAAGFAHVPVSRIYCSPLRRSIETAEIVVGVSVAPITPVPEFAEIDLGTWDGVPIEELRARFPSEYAARGTDLAGYRPPGGESFSDLAARVVPAFEALTAATTDGSVLIVGHAGVNRVLLCHILGMPLSNLFRLQQDYCCLNVLERVDGVWSVRGVNLRLGPAGALV